jgi:indole-3-glycerol phosphate synthase
MFTTKFYPAEIAKMYEVAGAAAISILTDEKYFHGSLSDLGAVREHTSLPLLRKDLILDEIQLFEAKAFGADAVLLIAAALDKHQLKDLHCAARGLGLETLVELYESREIDNIDFDQMKLIGINNRNLKTFTVDIQRSIQIASLLPSNITAVSESGIVSAVDLSSLRKGGIHSALIGGFLMKSDHPGKALRSLLNEFTHADKS